MSIKEGHVGYVQHADGDETDSQIDAGACGGGTPKHVPSIEALSESMIDEGTDNISMEVHLGEDSSRHPSEISSISYQNLLEDAENSSQVYSRRDSEDSNDSYPPDEGDNFFPSDDIERFEASDLPISEKYKKPSEPKLTSKVTADVEINIDASMGSDSSPVNTSQDIKDTKDKSPGPLDRHHVSPSNTEQDSDSVNTTNNSVLLRKKILSSEKDKSDPKEIIKKRNSLEIRNNIPTVGEVKSYDKDMEDLTYTSQGAKPKIRKQSPGLARRVCENDRGCEREGSSSERETDHPVNKEVMVCPADDEPEDPPGMEIECRRVENGVSQLLSQQRRPMDIENEYDYVKYARVQQGNSYVGMRLAYSSSSDSLNIKRNGQETGSIESSRETSPEKILHQKILQDLDHKVYQGQVNEDSLIEIPLNGIDGLGSEDKKSFTLSPENTECDSVEVESVMSDGERGMPTVEDGLSSSQASDYEDANNVDSSTPATLLKQKQKSSVKNTTELEKPKEIDAQAIMTDLKAKREALDSAIADIKTAIQQSKGVALQSSKYSSDPEEEPIWVMRENNNEQKNENVQKLHRQEEMRRVREEIERQQEQEYAKKEEQKVYEMEDEQEKLMNNQFTRNDGKVYQSPKGYESDDEHEGIEGKRYTRRIKGKKYAPLEKEDSLENGAYSNSNKMESNHTSSSKINNTNSISTSSLKLRHDSESHYSSEEYCSDREPLSRTTYVRGMHTGESDTDEETDRLLQKQYQRRDQYVEIPELTEPPVNRKAQAELRRSRAKEAQIRNPDNPEVLIEGVLFRARYLGSTQLISEGQPSKALRMMQAQEAVGRIKAPEGESQPSTDVDLFVSTEKLMVLNTDLQEIMMDHSLRTISYIADIGDVLVLMARRRLITSPGEGPNRRRQAKILCHVFESEEAQLIAQSIGQAFQVAYMEFLKANGIEDPGLLKEMDYQDVLNQQEIYGEELNLFANKDHHKEVIVPKAKNELLGVVIVESGWGSMVPTVVLANMSPIGPAARCGQLNIGDQIISINGISLVGLPLSACQTYIKAAKNQTVVKLTVVPCPPVVEVIIKRPDVKYQLGFSVQNGVICSLLRGGIAERGGVRVGHRIIEINNQSVVAVPHEKIVSLLANSVGEIHMKTMPTSIFRLLTGQDTPHYL